MEEHGNLKKKIHLLVAGIVLKGNMFLVEKRKSNNVIDPGIVCFPGGHIKQGETPESAIKREMKEEIGIIIKDFKHIYTGFCTDSTGKERAKIFYFKITGWEGKIKCREAEKLFWESESERLDTEIDRSALEKVVE